MLKKILFEIKFPQHIQSLLNYFFINKFKINVEYNYNKKKFNNLLEILQQNKKYRYSVNPQVLITPLEGKIKSIKRYGKSGIRLEFIQNIKNNHVLYAPIDSVLLSIENIKNGKVDINFLIKNTDIKYQIRILTKTKDIKELNIKNKKEFKKSEIICKLPLDTIVYIYFDENNIELLDYIKQNFKTGLGMGIAKIKKGL